MPDLCRLKYLTLLIGMMLSTLYAQTEYKQFFGYHFQVELPVAFKVTEPYGDNNYDHSNYEVGNENGTLLEIHSMLESRFDMDESIHSIKDWYEYILQKTPGISYKLQKEDWFIVSGTNEKNGQIFYWKKIWKGEFVADLYIEYPPDRKKEIEPFIGKIARSFQIS